MYTVKHAILSQASKGWMWSAKQYKKNYNLVNGSISQKEIKQKTKCFAVSFGRNNFNSLVFIKNIKGTC